MGRSPNAEELARIEQILQQQGFSKWEEIEFEDRMWEVEALDAEGNEHELKLDPQSFEIVSRER